MTSTRNDMADRQDIELDDEIELSCHACPKCGATAYRRDCSYCDEDGFSGHDCGEDTCCCFAPEDNVRCDVCRGRGYHEWCRKCGWDLLEQRYHAN
jgi:hypothetical protein